MTKVPNDMFLLALSFFFSPEILREGARAAVELKVNRIHVPCFLTSEHELARVILA